MWGFSRGSEVKNLPTNAGKVGLIPGLGRSPGEGNGNPLQYSCLGNPMDGGAWWATVRGHWKESDMTQWLKNNKVSSILINEMLETFLLKRVNIQNIQTAYEAQYQKNPRQSNPKMDGRPKQTFLQRRHTDGQEAHDKMLSITSCCCAVAQSCLSLCDPMDYNLPDSCQWNFSGKKTGLCCHFPLQGIFLTQELNLCLLCLLHSQADFLALVPPGKQIILQRRHADGQEAHEKMLNITNY